MNYSAINYVIYTIGLAKEMFVIGGTFAAGLSEPRLAKTMGGAGEHVEVYTSSSNFEVLKGFVPKSARARIEVEKDKIVIVDGYIRMTFHRGIPASWTNESGYMVMDSAPLKQWLINNEREGWAALLRDKPFEQRMAAWKLTPAEEEFKQLCAKHDWYSGYSDDASVARRGEAGLKVIKDLRAELGGNAGEIFDYYSTK